MAPGTRKVQILLSEAQDSRLKEAARRSGVTKSAFVRVALERELALDDRLARECAAGGMLSRAERREPDALQPLLF